MKIKIVKDLDYDHIYDYYKKEGFFFWVYEGFIKARSIEDAESKLMKGLGTEKPKPKVPEQKIIEIKEI